MIEDGPGPDLTASPIDAAAWCPFCGAPAKVGSSFCVACGRARIDVAPPPPIPAHRTARDGWRDFRVALGLFSVFLIVQVITGFAFHLDKRVFPAIVLGTIGFAIVTLAYALARRELVWPGLRRIGMSALGLGAIVAASPVIVWLVATYVRVLARSFGVHVPDELDGLKDHGFGVAILLVALAPPLTEELAFRGVILGSLRRHLRPGEALVLSSFAFAIAHLSIPSLITHLPLGLYFGWLAVRSGSLWPGVLAHACHNLGVILAERAGWF